MTKPNPFRYAKTFLAVSIADGLFFGLMFTVQGALQTAWFRSPNRKLVRKAIKHFRAMVAPHYSERAWLVHEVLNGQQPSEQDLQDYRHRWLNHMAKQWDEREIK